MWKKESVNPQTLMLMDTQPVSGCKLLRSCFSLVMQLNQNQFYCLDPIGNLLISCFLHFVQSQRWGSLYPASWWHFEEAQSPRPGCPVSLSVPRAPPALSGRRFGVCVSVREVPVTLHSLQPHPMGHNGFVGRRKLGVEFNNDRIFILLVYSAGFLQGLRSQAQDLKLVLMSVMSPCSRISQKPVCLNSIFNSNSLCSGDQQA